MHLDMRKRKYEIRLLNEREGQTVHDTWQANDDAATARALGLADEADAVEVWRDMECIYARYGESLHPPERRELVKRKTPAQATTRP